MSHGAHFMQLGMGMQGPPCWPIWAHRTGDRPLVAEEADGPRRVDCNRLGGFQSLKDPPGRLRSGAERHEAT